MNKKSMYWLLGIIVVIAVIYFLNLSKLKDTDSVAYSYHHTDIGNVFSEGQPY